MKRFLAITGSILAALLLTLLVFFWASSGRLPDEDLAQIKTYAAPPDSTAPDTLTVMTYNIGYLSGMTNNEPVVRPDSLFHANMDQVLSFFRKADPDVVGLQEIDFGGARVAGVHQLDTLATHLGYPVAAQAVNWDERYLPFPYGRPAVHFGRILSGQALLSRVPIRQHDRTVLSRPPQMFFRDAFYLDRLAQIVIVDVGGRALGLINVHLEAFDTETREQQARTVNALYDRLDSTGLPVLVLGDFNSPLTASPKADSTMQLLLDGTALQPARGDTASATFPADTPSERIDYIFYPPSLAPPVRTQRWCGAPHPPSDHCAVAASFPLSESTSRGPSVKERPLLDTLLTE